MSEVVREVPGLSYAVASQEIRRVWARTANENESMAVASTHADAIVNKTDLISLPPHWGVSVAR